MKENYERKYYSLDMVSEISEKEIIFEGIEKELENWELIRK